jgi:hypothetical protein
MKVTSTAFILPEGTNTPNAPDETHEICYQESGDDNAAMTTGPGKHVRAAANELMGIEKLQIEGAEGAVGSKWCRLNMNAGGDQAMMAAMNAVSGCNGSAPCARCECSKHELSTIGLVSNPRSRDRIRLLSHVKLGKCPGCDMQIVDVVTDKKREVALCVPGCVHPAVPIGKAGKGVTHLSLHHGIVPGQDVVFDIEPTDWTTCLLHANLCIVGGMFKRTIVSETGKLQDKKVDNTSQSMAIHALMKEAGMQMKPPKEQTSKKLDQFQFTFKSASFAGADAFRMMGIHGKMIDIIYPVRVCGPWVPDSILFGDDHAAATAAEQAAQAMASNKPAAVQRTHVRRVWHSWAKVWLLFNTDLRYREGVTRAQVHKERAAEMRVLTRQFVRDHVAAVGVTQGLYLHIVHAHLPDEIERWGDLRKRQSQGLEHCHKIRKRWGCDATNRRPGQRLQTLMTLKTIRAFIGREKDHTYLGSVHEQRKQATIKRIAAKVKRVLATMPSDEP